MKLVLDIPDKLAPAIGEIIRAYGRDDDGLSDANMMSLTVPEAVEADRLLDEILSQLEAKTD